LVISDYEDSWGSTVRSFREVVGRFELMSDARAAEWRGFPDSDLKAVHVVEDGPVRAVIEAVLAYHDSVCLLTYKLPYSGCSVDLDVTMFWNEKSRMAKLSLPVAIADGRFLGQVPYGVEELATNGDEVVSQQWQAVADPNRDLAFGVVDNGIYGSDFSDGELRISLLRGAVYSALSIGERPLVSADRYHPRIDQGERTFSLRFLFGKKSALIPRMGAIAAQFNEPPYLLSMFTDGRGELPPRGVSLSDPEVICGACKAADAGDGVIVRLFNPTTERKEGRAVLGEHSRGQRRVDPAEPGSNEAGGNGPRPALTGRAELPRDFDFSYSIGPAQVRTYHVRPTGEVSECDLIEEPLPPAR
jgi:alpha-mannosidase